MKDNSIRSTAKQDSDSWKGPPKFLKISSLFNRAGVPYVFSPLLRPRSINTVSNLTVLVSKLSIKYALHIKLTLN